MEYCTRCLLLLLLFGQGWLISCDQLPQRGDCDPGYLKQDGECVLAVGQPCNSSGDCLARICLANPTGEDRFCSIGCDKQDDCPNGFYCTLDRDKRCYPGQKPPPCQDDSDCQVCQRCQEGACKPDSNCTPCQLDQDCQACERCAGQECIQVAGCVTCNVDSECATCESCTQGQCVRLPGCTLCAGDDDCLGCYHCVNNACEYIAGCGEQPCSDDQACPSRTACLLDTILDEQVCLATNLSFGQDCSRGRDKTCLDEICVVESIEQSAYCSRICSSDGDCPSGFRCLPDESCRLICTQPQNFPPGNACQNDKDCETNEQICSLVWSQDTLGWQARCVSPNRCVLQNGQPCLADAECTSNICTQDGYCSPVCAADSDCPTDFFCLGLPKNPPGEPVAYFYGCTQNVSERYQVGEICATGDSDCRSGQCLESQDAWPLCSMDCIPGAAQCPDGLSCESQGETQTLCMPTVLSGSCTNDQDCTQEQLCALDPTGIPACLSLEQAGQAGSICIEDADCAFNWCLAEGVCTRSCTHDLDCDLPQQCRKRRYARPGSYHWLQVCSASPGSLTHCKADSHCPQGEVCRPQLNARGSGLEGRCGPPGQGSEIGQACQTPQACQRSLCLVQGYCSAMCMSAADCPDDFLCAQSDQKTSFSSDSYPISACQKKPAQVGQACPNGDSDCESNVCYHPAEGQAYCSMPCLQDADCTVPSMSCLGDQEKRCRFE